MWLVERFEMIDEYLINYFDVFCWLDFGFFVVILIIIGDYREVVWYFF